jgi:signal transduction histidine kinase
MPALAPDVEQCVYRVAQEALANVAHHANAGAMTLHLTIEGGTLVLLVRDDGVGFDPRTARSQGHFGLAGMRERARLVGGDLTIESAPGAGATVRLSIGV